MIRVIMLNVGDADAIIIRIIRGIQKFTILVDGGRNEEHGKLIIKRFENLGYRPQLVIATHLDQDHIGGLPVVLKKYQSDIKFLWTHRYEQRNHELETMLKIDAKAFSSDGERELMIASLQDLKSLVETANQLNIPILEPLSDSDNQEMSSICQDWGIKILGPSEKFLKSLLSNIRGRQDLVTASLLSGSPCNNIGQEGNDSPANESSVIFQILHDDKLFLFTGDAGLQAFGQIKNSLQKIFFLKVPHHGSKRNLNNEIIKILKPTISFISASNKNNRPHPDVEGCLKYHGSEVKCTGRVKDELGYYH